MTLSFEQLEPRQLMHGAPVQTGPLPDVDGDGRVGNLDFSMVLANWGHATPYGDATGDGLVSNADFSSVIAGWGQLPHTTDAAKQSEHTALMQLFNVRTTTAAVIHSGNWSDPLTWGGEVPAADAVVWVPAWYTLTVDGDVQAKHVRVDGQLSFAANSHLTVDTLVGSPASHLDIDLPNADETARITFAGDAIDTNWDKFAISRGMVWHGSSDIVGAEKSTWSWLTPARKGDTTITVSDTIGWRVGDRLVIGGAAYQLIQYKWKLVPQDDDVRIAAINGNVVTLDRPLAFDHAAIESQNPVVMNMTRNVVIESANPAIDRRGHVMFMHNPNQSIAFAEFNDLGRTDKSRILDATDNVAGRYALHFHRTGTESQAAVATGNAISGSPGWGLVNHDSNVHADSNVSYNVFGAHFVTELGNENGTFTNNVAIRADGTGTLMGSVTDTDFGHSGEGFWIEGGHVILEGNVAIGMRASGFTFFTTDDPITFRNNISLQSTHGLTVWSLRFPGVHFPQQAPADTVFSRIEGNLLHSGVLAGYSSCLEYVGNTVLAFNNNVTGSGFSDTGINENVRYIDNKVTGFVVGINMPTAGVNVLTGGYYDNLEVNLRIFNTQLNFYRRIDITNPTFGTQAPLNVDMSVSFFTYSLLPAYPRGKYQEFNPVPDWRKLFDASSFVIAQSSQVTLDGKRLYFEEQGSAFEFGKLLTRFPDEIRYEPDGVTLATGASLNARGLYVGGQALPAGEQYHLAGVRGVLINQ